jgi:hypothetical protein
VAFTTILLAGLEPAPIVGFAVCRIRGIGGIPGAAASRWPTSPNGSSPIQVRRLDNTGRASRPRAAGCTFSCPPCAIEHGVRVRPMPGSNAAGRLAWDLHVVERPLGCCRWHVGAWLA